MHGKDQIGAWVRVKSLQSCPTLCDPMDCSQPGSSVHGTLQVRTLEWVTMPSSRGSSQPRDGIQESRLSILQYWRPGFDPWIGKIPWQLTPVFLPGQRSLVGYSLWGHKESYVTERLSTAQHQHTMVCATIEAVKKYKQHGCCYRQKKPTHN